MKTYRTAGVESLSSAVHYTNVHCKKERVTEVFLCVFQEKKGGLTGIFDRSASIDNMFDEVRVTTTTKKTTKKLSNLSMKLQLYTESFIL